MNFSWCINYLHDNSKLSGFKILFSVQLLRRRVFQLFVGVRCCRFNFHQGRNLAVSSCIDYVISDVLLLLLLFFFSWNVDKIHGDNRCPLENGKIEVGR
jgi:hypothetical protein